MERKLRKNSLFRDWDLICLLLVMLLGYVLLHDLMGETLLSPNGYDSYTLQALAWLEGRMDIGPGYDWLELAIYDGRYYLSFPPVPTLAVLPLAAIFGPGVPANLLVALYAMLTAALAYLTLKREGMGGGCAAFAALFYVWGSNMMWMSTSGGVWFQAQGLCMLLLTAAVYFALGGRRVAAYAMAALAVGCRPFAIVSFLPLAAHFFLLDRDKPVRERVLGQLLPLMLPAIIGGGYMWYNWIRFGDVFEFGHNYLPEFLRAEEGQFSLSYLLPNLRNILFRPVRLNAAMGLEYTVFDGFMCFVANPLFILWGVQAAGDMTGRRMDMCGWCILLAMAAELLLLCAHKTMGGWQFGARYTVDLLPAALLYLARRPIRPARWKAIIMAAGIMFNLYGAVAMSFLHG